MELAAWQLVVPATVAPSTFLLLNAGAAAMFCIGLASAAGGLLPRSVGQIIDDLERDSALR